MGEPEYDNNGSNSNSGALVPVGDNGSYGNNGNSGGAHGVGGAPLGGELVSYGDAGGGGGGGLLEGQGGRFMGGVGDNNNGGGGRSGAGANAENIAVLENLRKIWRFLTRSRTCSRNHAIGKNRQAEI